MDLHKNARVAKHINEWLAWAEANFGEDAGYIRDDLVQDLANFIVLKEDA